MKPQFPIISIYKLQGLNMFKDDSILLKVSTYTLINSSHTENQIYDSKGKKWTFKFINNKIKNNFVTRSLAYTFYNPSVIVNLEWKEEGFYSLNELKNYINLCIDKDDDILTQFEEANVIKNAISNCINFEDILFILNKYIFEVNEEELWKKQENKG